MKNSFPKDFKWGAAVWAQGTEGAYDEDGKSLTTQEKYAIDNPLRMQQGIPPFETLDWYDHSDDYVEYMVKMHLNSFRTSITWARLMPDGVHVNEAAVKFYRHLFSSMREKNIDVWCVLYWFDMPLHFEDQGGFSNREITDKFADYCENCFKLFSDVVNIWYVYNEPGVDVNNKYLNDSGYPNEIDMAKSGQVTYNMLVAHAKAVARFKALNITSSKIGSVINLSFPYPRSKNPYDLAATKRFSLIEQDVWTDSIVGGYYPEEYLAFFKDHEMPITTAPEDKQLIADNHVDVMGLNHYSPVRIKARESMPNPEAPVTPDNFFEHYVMPGRQMNKYRGWEIYPPALYDTLVDLDHRFPGLEMYITENGMGVQDESRFRDDNGQIQDDYRIDYLKGYLEAASQAIKAGVNLRGYHMWSFVDLWSPSNQFLNCYGFLEFNPFEKKIIGLKKSAYWYTNVIDNNGFDE